MLSLFGELNFNFEGEEAFLLCLGDQLKQRVQWFRFEA